MENRSLLLKDRKTNLITNSLIDLGLEEDEGKGKGRYFVSKFIESGLAHYKELGDILITKETLDKFIQTMVGCPVIIDHVDVTDKNVDKLRVGVISRVWYSEMDGWYYCEGIITDNEAINLIKNEGWSVSCSYSFVSDDTKKTYHGKPIDMEFTDGEFLHLAIVKEPRYEGANIVVNKNDDDLEWITVKGNHIPVKKGQSKDEAVKEFLEGKEKGDQNNKEADIALTMMAQDYEKRGNKGTVDRANELKEKLKKGEELSDKDKQDIKTAIESYKPKDKSEDDGEKNKGYELSEKYKNHIQFKDDKESGGYPRKIHKDLDSAKKLYESKKEGQAGAEKLNLQRSGKRGIPLRDNPVIVKNPIGEGYIVATVGLAQKHNLKEVYPIDRTKASNSIGDITMTVLNDLTDFIKKVVKNEKEDEMKVKNEDKRKLIDEIGGILKDKVDDEIIRTVIKKAEELSYEPSEDDKADNKKAKNEDDKEDKEEAKNKCKNEEDEKEEDPTKNEDDDEEEKTENKKVKNSMKDFVMGGKSDYEEKSLYTSRAKRLEEGNKY